MQTEYDICADFAKGYVNHVMIQSGKLNNKDEIKALFVYLRNKKRHSVKSSL